MDMFFWLNKLAQVNIHLQVKPVRVKPNIGFIGKKSMEPLNTWALKQANANDNLNVVQKTQVHKCNFHSRIFNQGSQAHI